jgi:hypothetical protein
VRLTGLTGVEPLSESCPVSPAGTGLTGGAHRSVWCWSVDSRFGVPLRSQVGRVCVLVPRSSGTPVATWAWPTWVASRRRVLEVVFILLEFPSHSRRIFIDSHSLTPLWFTVSVLHRPGLPPPCTSSIVHDFILLISPPCGPHLVLSSTGSLEPSLLVSPSPGDPSRLKTFRAHSSPATTRTRPQPTPAH